jgi:type I restriction enzyme S subunit
MLDAAAVGQAFTSVPLRSVGRFVRGITFKPDDVINTSDTTAVFCMRTKNVQADLDLSDVWGIPSAFVKREEQFLQPGDILVSSANSWNLIGKCCWIPSFERRATFGGFVSVLRADPEQVEPRYLYRWFASDPVQAKLRSFGRQTTNISNLDLERCLAMQLPLPPLSEQRRIAAILDQADALRAKRRQTLTQLDEMARALFADVIGDPGTNPKGWSGTQLGALCHVRGGKRLPKGAPYAPGPTQHPYIRVSDLSDGAINEENLVFLTPEVQRQIARYTVAAGEIVISIAGTIGAVAVVPNGLDGANLTENAAKIVAARSGQYDNTYLATYLRTPFAQEQISARTGQVTIGKLALFRIEQLPVLLPPMAVQRKFAARLATIDALRRSHLHHAAKIDTLFASLQHRAFRGKL